MTKRMIIPSLTLFTLFAVQNQAWADSYKEYDPDWATRYAENNYDQVYGSGPKQNPFHDFTGANGANFVSQAILAGFVKSKDAREVFDERYEYDTDADGNSPYQWYFRESDDYGPAFVVAQKLYEYAKSNKPEYKGLHFVNVTHTLSGELDHDAVEKGDVVFADWNYDGHIDQVMLVTDVAWFPKGYHDIWLTYQGGEGGVDKTDVKLSDINEKYRKQALFYVYRPVDYNPEGL